VLNQLGSPGQNLGRIGAARGALRDYAATVQHVEATYRGAHDLIVANNQGEHVEAITEYSQAWTGRQGALVLSSAAATQLADHLDWYQQTIVAQRSALEALAASTVEGLVGGAGGLGVMAGALAAAQRVLAHYMALVEGIVVSEHAIEGAIARASEIRVRSGSPGQVRLRDYLDSEATGQPAGESGRGMSPLLDLLARASGPLMTNGLFSGLVSASVAVTAWVAGGQKAVADMCSTGDEKDGPNQKPEGGFGQPPCSGFIPMACCCLSYANPCPNGVCSDQTACWSWFCVDNDLRDWECIECQAQECSIAYYFGGESAGGRNLSM
jgi:hypothetical protein